MARPTAIRADSSSAKAVTRQRLRVTIRGAVQGVGFRPFIYRLATEMKLDGWVLNSAAGVFLEVEGELGILQRFLLRVESDKPPISFIQSLESSYLDPVGYCGFEIRASVHGEKTALVMPDIATCPDCLREIFDSTNRRFRYPFTNCTNCGPRFSIIEGLPYDRPLTTMKSFVMCAECKEEYSDPCNRRFHAQPNACPICGPRLELWNSESGCEALLDDALKLAAEAIKQGKIVAVKGLGGFHLMCDGRNEETVNELRRRKHREAKPLALMYPAVEMIERDCVVGEIEARLLRSPESPIVLLRTQMGSRVRLAPSVAPENPYLGVMLPYTPLHHLLMAELKFPVVATSGNLSDEPICIDECEAVQRLKGIADLFLVHNRPIVRHVDDSILRVVMGRELVLRRARGFAPLPNILEQESPSVLAVGAHQKNTIAASIGKQVFISQHIGDLETEQAFGAFESVVDSFQKLYEFAPEFIACDQHPNYMSSQYARQHASKSVSIIQVQHHYAHVLACMAENAISAPVLGISWDGSGYGPDGTVWGGEFLGINDSGYERVAHLRTFRLPGGERAVREPRRAAAGLLFAMFGEDALSSSREFSERVGISQTFATVNAFTPAERGVVLGMLQRNLNSPVASSAGRLFDAIASLTGVRQVARFEGQAAMELEFLATTGNTGESYTINLEGGGEQNLGAEETAPPSRSARRVGHPSSAHRSLVVDWARMIVEISMDLDARVAKAQIARKFHNTLAEAILLVAKEYGEERVALSGGCFQNRLLTELAVTRLKQCGFQAYWHQRIPPNDGGIALGQIVAAARASRAKLED